MLRTFNIKQGDQFSFTVTFTNLQEDLTTFTMGVKRNYQDVMLITDTGTIIRMHVNEISVLGRSTQGVTLMRTNDGGKVVSIEIVDTEEEE